jgi:hypothetical protein
VSLSKQLELDQAKSKFDITVRKKQKTKFDLTFLLSEKKTIADKIKCECVNPFFEWAREQNGLKNLYGIGKTI